MDEHSFHPLDYVSVLHRRKWWFIVPRAACIVGGVLVLMLVPWKYESEAEIGIAAPTLSPELLRAWELVAPSRLVAAAPARRRR